MHRTSMTTLTAGHTRGKHAQPPGRWKYGDASVTDRHTSHSRSHRRARARWPPVLTCYSCVAVCKRIPLSNNRTPRVNRVCGEVCVMSSHTRKRTRLMGRALYTHASGLSRSLLSPSCSKRCYNSEASR